MRTTIHALFAILSMAHLISPSPAQADSLRLHAISGSGVVLQRENERRPHALNLEVFRGLHLSAGAETETVSVRGSALAPRAGKATSQRPQGHSPMGNLTVNGHPDMPLPEFRTDSWCLPETDEGIPRNFSKPWEDDVGARLDFRRTEEAKHGREIIERLKTPGQDETESTPTRPGS